MIEIDKIYNMDCINKGNERFKQEASQLSLS